jgi:hypothetical protein
VIATYTGALTGMFDSVTEGYTINYDTPGEIKLVIGNVLAGDYNNDGVVNTADYVVWRNSLNGGAVLQNETVTPGTVDQADYNTWRANFGAGGTGVGPSAAVPEPATLGILLFGGCLCCPARRPRHKGAV